MKRIKTGAASRATRQRAAILEALATERSFLSARQVHSLLAGQQREVALATVYRALKSLSEQGVVDVIPGDGEALYCLCDSSGHHHHLVCRTCGVSVELQNPALESWTHEIADEHGFQGVDHTLELYGTCRSCASA